MARLVISDEFKVQVELFKAIKFKVDADGPTNIVNNYLTENNIVLANDETDMNAALALFLQQGKNERESEDLTEERNNLIDPVMGHIRGIFKSLKGLYGKDYAKVGLWGADITVNGKINYPSDFIGKADLWDRIAAKFATYMGAPTPIDPYLAQHNLTIPTTSGLVAMARTKHLDSKQKARDAEENTQDRYLLWDPVVDHIYGIGGYLMAIYSNNPQKLGQYGFTVDNSPKPPKPRNSTIGLEAELKLKGVVIDSILKNTGTVPVEVYRGTNTLGPFTKVAPGGEFGIKRGFSNIVVKNTSSLEKAKVRTMVN